ncbi:hypothetical protein I3679_009855 [Proteus mirabilis]|uniref:cGAS/DncV-like nucleotidyltransferase C-terminal helical domain-containing protein n=1 Tax=Proteus mirabilis TaxID=584 RepID=A0ABD5LW95_PROMI
MECLAYNCPETVFAHSTWTERLKAMLIHIWDRLQGDEPTTDRWLEVNECFFFSTQIKNGLVKMGVSLLKQLGTTWNSSNA